jgi:D-amino-acid oxidase
MNRRDFVQQSSTASLGLALAGCARWTPTAAGAAALPSPATAPAIAAPALPFYDKMPTLAPIRADSDRLFRITVCLRPFRAQGPRIETERVGNKLVVHNYGHGGSGWSLSWGSSGLALEQARAAMDGDINQRAVAVIGCGALGLTSATLLQRAGAKVTIYAKERPPEVRSARATGSWTPDSRVALTHVAPASFGDRWERMARASWSMYQSYLGMPGNPVEYYEQYALSDNEPETRQPSRSSGRTEELDFARYASRIADIMPKHLDLPPGTHPFPTTYARRSTSLLFNVADYSRQLVTDFLIAGGKIETVEFHTPAELAVLEQTVIVNCTGYGARQLWMDESITPVRGQIGWLIPQPDVNYGVQYRNINVLGRRDGIVVQVSNQGEATGWNNTNEMPDREEAEGGVQALAELYSRMMPHAATAGRTSS